MSVGRADSADHVGADVIPKISRPRTTASGAPASAGARIALHARFVSKPQLDLRLLLQAFDLLQKSGSRLFVLTLWPRTGNPQIVTQIVQIANQRAVAQFHRKALLEPAVELDASPMQFPGPGRVFQHRHKNILKSLEFDLSRPPRNGLAG